MKFLGTTESQLAFGAGGFLFGYCTILKSCIEAEGLRFGTEVWHASRCSREQHHMHYDFKDSNTIGSSSIHRGLILDYRDRKLTASEAYLVGVAVQSVRRTSVSGDPSVCQMVCAAPR